MPGVDRASDISLIFLATITNCRKGLKKENLQANMSKQHVKTLIDL
jgi:hypothetical protein